MGSASGLGITLLVDARLTIALGLMVGGASPQRRPLRGQRSGQRRRVTAESLGSTVATGGKASACSVEMIYLGANVPVEAPAQYDAVVCNGFPCRCLFHLPQRIACGPKFIVQHASSPAVLLLVGDIDTAATPVFPPRGAGDQRALRLRQWVDR